MVREFAHVLVTVSVAVTACHDPGEPADSLDEIWFQPQVESGFTRSRPEVVGDTVVFGSAAGMLIARAAASGVPVWSVPVCGPGGPQGQRFARAGPVLLVSCAEKVVAIDLGSHSEKWAYDPPPDTTYDGLPGVTAATQSASDGSTFYVPAWGATVSALAASTGHVTWVWRPGRLATDTAANVFRSGASGVAVAGDTVLVTVWHQTNPLGGTSESLLFALDRITGAELWRLALNGKTSGGGVATPPELVGDLAVVLGLHGELYAVNRSTGQLAWQYKSPAYQYGTSAATVVVGTTIYASLGDEKLTALRASDGQVLWAAPPLGATKDLFATESRVYVPRNGMLNIHDRATGKLVATGRVKGDGQAFMTAAVALGTQIFITSSEGAWSFREPQ